MILPGNERKIDINKYFYKHKTIPFQSLAMRGWDSSAPCQVVAAAYALDIEITPALALLSEAGWSAREPGNHLATLLMNLGWERISVKTEPGKQYLGQVRIKDCVVSTDEHITAIVGGVVYDLYDSREDEVEFILIPPKGRR